MSFPHPHTHNLHFSLTQKFQTADLNKTFLGPQRFFLKVVAGGQHMEHVELSRGTTAAVQSYSMLEKHLKNPSFTPPNAVRADVVPSVVSKTA